MRAILPLALLMVAAPALAQEAGGRSEPHRQVAEEAPSHEEALLFVEKRKRLYDRGIDLHLEYTTESSLGLSGVKGARYTGQLEFGVKLDLEKLADVRGGTFNLVLNNREGQDFSTDKIGNFFRVQEVYGANKDLRLVYLTYEQEFANGRASLLVGRTNLGQEFAHSDLFCQFQSNGICGRPLVFPKMAGSAPIPSRRGELGSRSSLSRATAIFRPERSK